MVPEFPIKLLGEVSENFDRVRVPLSSRERSLRQGRVPYYGAAGVIDWVNDSLLDGMYVLVGEDGSVETEDGRPVLQLPKGRMWVNNHAHILRGETDEETRFLYYALSTVEVRPYLSGSVQPKLTQENLNRIRIPYPSDGDRRRIASVLGSLDDKIELNRRMNQTLEQIAQALFKSWFVDFDPVHAKAEGRWKRGESLPGMPADMWDLWPSEFEESEIGEIPKGWKPDSLTKIAALLTGGTPSTAEPAYWDGGIPWVSGKDVSAAKGGFIIQTERTITHEGIENSATTLLPARTVVITARGTVGALGVLASDMCISQTNYGLKASDGIGDNLLLFTVRNAIDQLQQSSYGTIFDTITTRNLQGTIVVLPPEPLRSEFERRTHPLMERVLLNLREEETLASTRDALLPKLLSGEIRVPIGGGA